MSDEWDENAEGVDEDTPEKRAGNTWMTESEPPSSGFGCFRVMLAGLTGVVALCAGVPLPHLAIWSCVAVITLLRDYTTGLSPEITAIGCIWRLISIGLWLSVLGSILESV